MGAVGNQKRTGANVPNRSILTFFLEKVVSPARWSRVAECDESHPEDGQTAL